MLPAAQGDSLWVEYGSRDAPHRILIDGGTPPTYKKHLKQKLMELGQRPLIELLVVTHIDTDHIGGVLKLFNDHSVGLHFGQVWFNAWRHIAPDSRDLLGGVDGEIFTVQLNHSGFRWNTSFQTDDHAARVAPDGHSMMPIALPGGMKLTVVSPGLSELALLREEWETVVKEGGLVAGVPSARLADKASRKGVKLDLLGDPIREWADGEIDDLDKTAANGSSIAVFAEYTDEGVTKRCLLAGDAHGPVLTDGIRRLAQQLEQDRLQLDAFKVPHHGSHRNVTRDLIQSVDCRHYMFSTNGAINEHPHKEAVARVLAYGTPGATLHFNYRTKFNEIWDVPGWQQKYEYHVEYGDGTLTVSP